MSTKSTPSILLVYPSCFYDSSPRQRDEVKSSQLLLASYLSYHFPVEYADLEFSIGRPTSAVQVRRFERKVREFLTEQAFDILAISCWTSLSYKATITVARIARELYPDCLIVVGGYHPAARPEDFRTENQAVDYVIRGEGELALTEIARSFPAVGRPAEMKVVDGPTIFPEQFVGMNWEIVDRLIETNFPGGVGTLCIYLSRGCPFECTFCVESLKDRCWRPFPPDQAIEQMRLAGERYPLQAVAIGDACFGVNKEWRKEFLKRLLDLKPSHWVLLETRPEFLDHEDVEALAQLKTEIQFGIESCSPQMLRVMNKTKQPERFLEKFRELTHQLSDLGVVHGANLIFNHPGETQKTLEETFAFMDAEFDRGRSALIWSCHTYVHFPGSEIDLNQRHYEEKYGSVFLSPNWWQEDVDPNISSRKVIPSRDLSGERLGLWRQMFNERRERFMNSLIPEAFLMGADNYYPDWQNDPRYLEAMRKAGPLTRK